MKVKILNLTMMLWAYFFIMMQQVNAGTPVANINETQVNIALGEYQLY